LIGLSPLPSSHPSGFQPTWVRSSTACYGGFNLLLGRSPRLRVYAHAPSRPIQTRFRFGSGPEGLNQHVISNSPDHNAKGTPSDTYVSSDRLSAHGFRISFTRHLACFSPFPHGTRALSVIEEYLGLEGGPPRFAQNSTCSALLGIPLGAVRVQLPGFHRLWRAIPCRFTLASCSPRCGPTTPRGQAPTVWPLPRSLTATRRISVDFFSSRY
jgi:hypothetical protein